jgi:dihydroorotase
LKLPGLTDVHVHLRVPGGEHKEDFLTGTQAALAGGFTRLLAMPNTKPPLVTLKDWKIARNLATNQSLCDVFLYAGGSSEHLDELAGLGQVAAAIKLYLDQTYGPLRLQGLASLQRIFEQWPKDKPIVCHAEEESVAVVLGLASIYKRSVHICHVSRQSEVELIAKARAEGVQVTCEVTPHHLFLNENDAKRLGPYGDMRPVLQAQSDVDALWRHLGTTIDCVASDHAPHTIAEKGGRAEQYGVLTKQQHLEPIPEQSVDNYPPGIPGLESTLPLLLTAASQGRIPYDLIPKLLDENPRRIFGLPIQPETWIEIDQNASYDFPDHPLYTKCGWSPFVGMRMTGLLRRVVLRGKIVYQDGLVLAGSGSS